MSYKKGILSALAVVAGVGAALAVKVLHDEKTKDASDDEVHFIHIDDEEYPEFDLTNKTQEVVEVCGVYPYLNPTFVEKLLNRNNELNEKYAKDTLVHIVHTVRFQDITSREGFEAILSASGYAVSRVGDKEATASKKLFIEEGAIISDILNVANQACALNGTYEKFDVFE